MNLLTKVTDINYANETKEKQVASGGGGGDRYALSSSLTQETDRKVGAAVCGMKDRRDGRRRGQREDRRTEG